MRALALASVSLRRILRDRTALFFIVALPVVIILVIGTVTNAFDGFRVTVIDEDRTAMSARLTEALADAPTLDVQGSPALDAARTALRRSHTDAVVVIPRGYGELLEAGTPAPVGILGERTNETQRAARAAIAPVITREAERLQAAQFVAARAGGSVRDRLEQADATASSSAAVTVALETVDVERRTLPAGYSYSAPTMLILFVFINCLAAGGAGILQTRELRLYDRMLAAPVTARTLIAGEALAYFALGILESLLIVGTGRVLFGVEWGDPLAAAALVAIWALLATAAGVLSGSLFKTAEQAGSIGPAIGIAFGMLGGTMWPLEIVPPVMRTIGHVVPHGWAVDAWTLVVAGGAGITGIARHLAVLLGFAAALLALATVRLRARLTA